MQVSVCRTVGIVDETAKAKTSVYGAVVLLLCICFRKSNCRSESHIIVVCILAFPDTSCIQTWLIGDVMITDINFTIGGM